MTLLEPRVMFQFERIQKQTLKQRLGAKKVYLGNLVRAEDKVIGKLTGRSLVSMVGN